MPDRIAPRRRALAIVTVAVGAATAPLTAQPVVPRFAWPAGATATVTMTMRTTTAMGMGGDTSRDTARSVLTTTVTVREDRGALRIDLGKARVAPGSTPGTQPMASPALAGSGSAFLVSRDGRFLDLADTLAVARELDSVRTVLRTQAAALASLAPKLAADFASGIGVGVFRDAARQAWGSLVGDWIDRPWSPGDSVASTVSQPFPLVPGAVIEAQRTLRFEGEVACPAGRAGRCLRFVQERRQSAEAMKALLRPLFAELEGADEMPIPAVSTTARTILIVDAATFRPWRMEETTTATSAMAAMESTQVFEIVSEYDWR